MNASPELIRELASSRPTAPPALRAKVRELAAEAPTRAEWSWPSLRIRRFAAVAAPALLVVPIVLAGVLGLLRSEIREVFSDASGSVMNAPGSATTERDSAVPSLVGPSADQAAPLAAGANERAQRVNATLTLEVPDSDGVARAAQDALATTRALGGHIVSSSVTTGSHANATLTVRIPVENVQRAIAQLSALGEIVSQQVQVEDLQATLDALRARRASLVAQIARITARVESETLSAQTRAALVARRQNLRSELRVVRGNLTSTGSQAQAATMQLTIATPDVLGFVTAPSRLDRTLDEALNVLAWEGIVALAVAIVVAPFALVALLVWLGRRLYRRQEEERLLAT